MTQTMPLKSTEPSERSTLYFKEGSSDKVYQAWIEARGTGFVVNFAYGRRGSTFQTGCKTPAPVNHDQACKILDKLLSEKQAKGYTKGQEGARYQGTAHSARATSILPQLLNAIDEQEAALLIADPAWWAQEKLDGQRILIHKAGEQVIGINRNGLSIALPESIDLFARQLGGAQWILDGEAIGEVFHAFDLLEQACVNLRTEPYSKRLKALYELLTAGCKDSIRSIPTALGTQQKRGMLNSLQAAKREGIVFKRRDGLYVPGRPHSGGDQRKFKFTASASCIVGASKRNKRSIALELLDGGNHVSVGNVTIPPQQKIPSPGSVVEVRYLYAYPGGSLFQPVYLGLRSDIEPDACIVGQLKFKAGEDE